jgi:hypothetical protein
MIKTKIRVFHKGVLLEEKRIEITMIGCERAYF